jgi:hypothetical protein
MAQQFIDVGNRINDGNGDSLRAGAQKINSNFTELYAALGTGVFEYISAGQGIAIDPASGTISLSDNISAPGAITAAADLSTSGQLYVKTLNTNGSIKDGPAILPGLGTDAAIAVTNRYDIGADDRRFRDIYSTRVLANGDIAADGNIITQGTMYTRLSDEFGNVSIGSAILPGVPDDLDANVNDKYDIGSSARRFRTTYSDLVGDVTGNVTGNVIGVVTGGLRANAPIVIANYSTGTRDLITPQPGQGALIYNSTTFRLQFWNGTSWGELSTTAPPDATTLVGTTIAANVIHSSLTDLGTLTELSVNGITTITGATTVSNTINANGAGGIATNQTTFSLVNDVATTVNFANSATSLSIGAITGGMTTVNNSLTVIGNLTVNGTTTTVNSTTYTVDDKNIELASVDSPTNATADGAGITIKGDTDKTILWDSANANFTSSEHWNIVTGKTYKINNVDVLSSTTLGSGVVNSSLTSVGTLGTLTVTGTIGVNGTTLSFGDVPVTNRYYIDPSRTDTYTKNGSEARPYKTMAEALAAIETAIGNGLNPAATPVYLVLRSNLTESFTLTRGHVYLVGENSGIHAPILITGNITINPTSGSISDNHFSIMGLQIVGAINTKTIFVTGTTPLRVFIQDVWVTASGTGTGYYQDNSGSGTVANADGLKITHSGTGDVYCINMVNGSGNFNSVETSGAVQVAAVQTGASLTFNASELDANGDTVLETYGTGTLTVTNSLVTNAAANGNGIRINAAGSTVIVGNTFFTIPTGTGKAIWYEPTATQYGSTLAYASLGFTVGNNTTIDTRLLVVPQTIAVGTIAASTLVTPVVTTNMTTSSTSFDLLNTTATTVNFAGAATTLTLGATTGTLNLRNATITAANATTVNLSAATNININGASPTISTSSTGTVSLFNTNANTINFGGAATAVAIGSSSSTTTVQNLKYNGLEIAPANYIAVGATATYVLSTTQTNNVLVVASAGYVVTLTFPGSPVEGQLLKFTVTTNGCTLALTSGPTLVGTFGGAVGAPATFIYIYRSSNTTWYRLQ